MCCFVVLAVEDVYFHIFNALKHLQSDICVSVSTVSRPTNVTLYCHNTKNILQWSYEQPTPGLKFIVEIGSTDGKNQLGFFFFSYITNQISSCIS